MIARTRQLLIAVLALCALDLGVYAARRRPEPIVLPSAPGFDPSDARSLQIVGSDRSVTLLRTPTGWQLSSLPSAPADPVEVEAILAALSAGIRPDLRIGDQDHESYGLSGGDELRVEVDGEAGRLTAFHVGHDAGGGATWIRFPDRDDVYRARIGGRARFDRTAGAWRDRQVTDLDPLEIERVVIRTADQTLTATRADRSWIGSPEPVDGPTVDRLLLELARLQAADAIPDDRGVRWDGASLSLETKDDIVELGFGSDGPLRYVRRGDRPDRWRIVAPWVDRLSDPDTFRDRTIWTASRLERLALRAPGREGLLVRIGDGWRIERPANVDLDPDRAEAVAAWLQSPRVVRWGPIGGPLSGDHRWEITLDGVERRIELGPIEVDRAPIRVGERTGWIEARVVQAVEGLFGG